MASFRDKLLKKQRTIVDSLEKAINEARTCGCSNCTDDLVYLCARTIAAVTPSGLVTALGPKHKVQPDAF